MGDFKIVPDLSIKTAWMFTIQIPYCGPEERPRVFPEDQKMLAYVLRVVSDELLTQFPQLGEEIEINHNGVTIAHASLEVIPPHYEH
jgi:hypothetical protein